MESTIYCIDKIMLLNAERIIIIKVIMLYFFYETITIIQIKLQRC